MSADWQTAFVAVSVLLGEPITEVASALTETASSAASELLEKLGGVSREARARALARVLSEVALAIEDARLA